MITQIDHVNIVVRGPLEPMIAFYSDLLGLELTKRVQISGPWISATVGLPDVSADVVYLDPPTGPRVELIRYLHPTAPTPPGLSLPNTPGLRHLAFTVTGIERYVATLRSRGVTFFSDVQTVPTSQVTYPGAACKHIVYFQDPEGNLLELCEYKA